MTAVYDFSGEIDDDALGLALERAGVTVDAQTLERMIQVPTLQDPLDDPHHNSSSRTAADRLNFGQVADKNKDGRICRREWNDLVDIMMSQFASEGQEPVRFAPKPEIQRSTIRASRFRRDELWEFESTSPPVSPLMTPFVLEPQRHVNTWPMTQNTPSLGSVLHMNLEWHDQSDDRNSNESSAKAKHVFKGVKGSKAEDASSKTKRRKSV